MDDVSLMCIMSMNLPKKLNVSIGNIEAYAATRKAKSRSSLLKNKREGRSKQKISFLIELSVNRRMSFSSFTAVLWNNKILTVFDLQKRIALCTVECSNLEHFSRKIIFTAG